MERYQIECSKKNNQQTKKPITKQNSPVAYALISIHRPKPLAYQGKASEGKEGCC